MAGNDSPRLVKILIQLARNWANTKNRYDRATKRLQFAKASAAKGGDASELNRLDGEADTRGEEYDTHPFEGFVRLVSHETGFDQEALRDAARTEFDGKREMVVALNALDENGTTGALFAKLWEECPEIASRLFGDGAEQSKMADLLGRAGAVFELANELGRAFQEEMQSQSVFMAGGESPRQRHQAKIDELVTSVLELRAPMQNPPDGTEAVVDQLRKAGRIAKRLPETNDGDILGLFPDLRTVASDGYDAIKAVREASLSIEPFAFLDDTAKPATVEAAIPATPRDANFIDRLLAGRDDVELTPRELALLESQLKQPIDFAAVQQERRVHPKGESETWSRHSKLKLIRDLNLNLLAASQAPSESEPAKPLAELPDTTATKATSKTSTPKKTKRSTARGEAKIKLIAALTTHHRDADGTINPAPIGNNELARLADVDRSTASEFFAKEFNGHSRYKAICADPATIAAALKMLNGEFSPHLLYGGKPPGEVEREKK